jgi:tetratricopeptide (TPR) repeat protein
MKPHFSWPAAAIFLAALTLFLVSTGGKPLAAADKETTAELDSRIGKLIEELGSSQYATREKAQAQLRSLGLAAFDALLEARYHKDIEVAQRVRFLLRGIPVAWVRDTDPPEVKSVLRNYGQQGRDERVNRMQLLAQLEDSQGIAALSRLMRFEVDPVLSKKAALQILTHSAPEDPGPRAEVVETIREAVGESRRPAADWVRTYTETLVSAEQALDRWQRLAQRELDTLAKDPEETHAEVVRDLLRWHVDQLLEFDRNDEAQSNIARVVELVEGDYDDLFDFIDWALEREAWFVPEKLVERFPSEYRQQAYLMYRLAESRRKLGNEEAAEEAAAAARQIAPDRFQRHTLLARYLRSRQLYDWSEQEFRYVIDSSGDQKAHEVDARDYLSQMLFDLQREREAAEVLEGSVAIVEMDPMAFQSVVSEAELQASVDYYKGVHYGRAGDHEKEQEHLKKAVENNPANIDIVIAMYRVPEPKEEWRALTTTVLESTIGDTRGKLRQIEQALLQTQDPDKRDELNAQLAQKNNELAWVISNTEGDQQEALACSQESLRLMPGAWAYLDTLGRCYYALGDYENAVRNQKQAVDGAPYLQQMQRQLKLFEGALEGSAAKDE